MFFHSLLNITTVGLALAAARGATRVPARDATDPHQLERRLTSVMRSAVSSGRVVGAVVVVIHDGQVVYRHAEGLADREAARPMRVDEVFRLSSISKPIVTAAALRMLDQGRLSLDAPVTRYLPKFRPRLPDGESPIITIRQLLTHTAGLSYRNEEPADGPYQRAGVSDGLDAPGLTMDEELRRIVAAGLVYRPGTSWRYSVAIDVLGAVMEQAAERTLPEVVKDMVTGPLGLPAISFEAPVAGRLATPYADGSPPVRMGDPHLVPYLGNPGFRFSPSRVFDARSFPSGGAGMNGTAEQVARFLEAMRAGALLAPHTRRAMLSNQTGSLPVAPGPGWGFGFGGAVLADPAAANTPQSAGTWCWGGAWGHSWFVDPERKLVVVALTNTAIEGMVGEFPRAVRDAVY